MFRHRTVPLALGRDRLDRRSGRVSVVWCGKSRAWFENCKGLPCSAPKRRRKCGCRGPRLVHPVTGEHYASTKARRCFKIYVEAEEARTQLLAAGVSSSDLQLSRTQQDTVGLQTQPAHEGGFLSWLFGDAPEEDPVRRAQLQSALS
jgi:hypothetical protein